MRDILGSLRGWYDAGERFGLATVVGVSHSAPRQPGASMAVTASGEAVGSVSGGCVEGTVYDIAAGVIESGEPVLQTFGYSDEDAFAVGLTCGGIVTLFVQAIDRERGPELAEAFAAIDAGEPVAVATVIAGGNLGRRLAVWPQQVAGSLGTEGLDAAVTDDARGMLEAGSTGQRHYGPAGERRRDEVTVFVESYAPPPRMLVFGAIDFAAAVAQIGSFLGYRVTVCDARAVFATAKRFPDAHEVVVEWPHRYLARTSVDSRTVICVLTHDPKFDVPLLEVALRTPAAYVGAMGSRRTHDERLAQLKDIGLSTDELSRLRSPVGLDLGARTPQETAVSIAAEIIALRWEGSGRPLSHTSGDVHAKVAR